MKKGKIEDRCTYTLVIGVLAAVTLAAWCCIR